MAIGYGRFKQLRGLFVASVPRGFQWIVIPVPPYVRQSVRPGVQQQGYDVGVSATGGKVQRLPIRVVDREKLGILPKHRPNGLDVTVVSGL